MVDGPVVELASLRGQRPSEGLVRSLRSSAGVTGRIEGPADAALVAVLSMSGVPVVLLDAEVQVDLADPLAREEHSRGATPGGARGVLDGGLAATAADRTGVRVAPEPSVSVVLATKRPEMLAFALRQVRKQRGVDLQLVLAPHGFTPGRRRAARAGARAPRRPAAATSPCCSATCSPTPSPPPTATWC